MPVKIRWFLQLTIALSATLTSLEVTVTGVGILPGGNVMDNGGSKMHHDSYGRIGIPRADTPSVKTEISEPQTKKRYWSFFSLEPQCCCHHHLIE